MQLSVDVELNPNPFEAINRVHGNFKKKRMQTLLDQELGGNCALCTVFNLLTSRKKNVQLGTIRT